MREILSSCLSVLLAGGCRCGSGEPADAPAAGEPAEAPAAGDPCSTPTAAVDGGWRSIDVDGTSRDYILDVPEAPMGRRLPLVMSFHGIGADPESLREVTGLGRLARSGGFVAVHPQGLTVRLGARMGPGWSVSARANRDVRLAEEIVSGLGKSVCIDTSRVIAMGFSNGAHLAHVLGCRMGGSLAGIGAVGGGLKEMAGACGKGGPTSVVILHGDADRVVPVEDGREAYAFWAARGNCTGEEKTLDGACVAATGCEDGARVVYCEVQGMGHTWPQAGPGQPLSATEVIVGTLLGPDNGLDSAPSPGHP